MSVTGKHASKKLWAVQMDQRIISEWVAGDSRVITEIVIISVGQGLKEAILVADDPA